MSGTDHPHDRRDEVSVGVLTVSSSRTLDEDPSGDALVAAIESGGHEIAGRELVGDDRERIRVAVLALSERAEAVVVTGGTGLAPGDVTVDAVAPLCDRTIPGFGELFRVRSYEDIGPRALLSRAYAGVLGPVPVFCLPGSTQAATFGAEELVVPTVSHVITHTQRD